jgi:hypothetical protein
VSLVEVGLERIRTASHAEVGLGRIEIVSPTEVGLGRAMTASSGWPRTSHDCVSGG